jgi:hypothetical protein
MQDIIIFGVGEIGKDAISYLKDKCRILFLVDNDESKWGSFLEKHIIKSPNQIKQYSCKVIVASTKYLLEIVNQLQKIGVHQDRIYLCRRYQTDTGNQLEIYPLNVSNVITTKKKLIEYDLLENIEQASKNTRIMVYCTFYSTYTKQLIENMSKYYDDIEYGLITNKKEYKEKIESQKLKHIYCFQSIADLKTILEQLPIYDVMQLLWIEREWAFFYNLIRKKAKKLNLNVGGSDFYRASKEERAFKRELVKCADKVTAETVGTIQDFKSYYKDVVCGKIELLPFGIEVLELINSCRAKNVNEIKEKYNIPYQKIVVTCGYNAGEAHQHRSIIKALDKLSDNVKQNIVCVFPMTYPSQREEYIGEVREYLSRVDIDYIILTEFMDFMKMAEYAVVSDIMIHVQTTDQLSSTMLEQMYSGSVIITGDWLPYKSLHEMGIYFLDVSRISDVTTILEDVVMNLQKYKEKCKGNEEIIWKHSSWDTIAPKWRDIWE